MSSGISAISVVGFKSLSKEYIINIRPLTIFAGANSSGKSSIMQPLLMMKQTLHESYDPGDLKLNGPNAKFTKLEQFLSRNINENLKGMFQIKIFLGNRLSLIQTFSKNLNKGIKINAAVYKNDKGTIILRPNMTQDDLLDSNSEVKKEYDDAIKLFSMNKPIKIEAKVERNRCFLKIVLYGSAKNKENDDTLIFSSSVFGLDSPYELNEKTAIVESFQ
jgi:AAA15 family ATPase/GTPase